MNIFEMVKNKIIKDAKQLYYSMKMGVIIDEVIDMGEIERYDPISKDERTELLHKHLTPQLEQLGLSYVRNNVWLGEENSAGIRRMVQYNIDRIGDEGTISWGACLSFLPMPSGKRLAYGRTNSTSKLHLFESSSEIEYLTDLPSKDREKGSMFHFQHRFENDLIRVVNEQMPSITRWFSRAETLDDLIEIAQEQLKDGWTYHHPSQHYVLSYLHAKKGNETKAFEYLNGHCIDDFYGPHLDKISSKLKELCTK